MSLRALHDEDGNQDIIINKGKKNKRRKKNSLFALKVQQHIL